MFCVYLLMTYWLSAKIELIVLMENWPQQVLEKSTQNVFQVVTSMSFATMSSELLTRIKMDLLTLKNFC